MKFKFLLVSALFAAMAGNGLAARQGDGASPIARNVSSILRSDPQLTVFDYVDARLDGSGVTLWGKVTTPAKKQQVEKKVSAMAGGQDVRSEIGVLPASISDDNLRHRVAKAIYGNPTFWSYAAMPNPPIHIIVEHGQVTLRGTVNTALERSMARSLATGLGEVSVINELKAESR
jgi:osmotically-inducible protein OsmY